MRSRILWSTLIATAISVLVVGAPLAYTSWRLVSGTARVQIIALAVVLTGVSAGTGVAIATVTARQLTDPLRDVADRVARLGAGDFRRVPVRSGIPEFDHIAERL